MKALSTNYKPVFIELKNLLSFAIFLFFLKFLIQMNVQTENILRSIFSKIKKIAKNLSSFSFFELETSNFNAMLLL